MSKKKYPPVVLLQGIYVDKQLLEEAAQELDHRRKMIGYAKLTPADRVLFSVLSANGMVRR